MISLLSTLRSNAASSRKSSVPLRALTMKGREVGASFEFAVERMIVVGAVGRLRSPSLRFL